MKKNLLTPLFITILLAASKLPVCAQLNFNVQKIELPKPFSHAFIQNLMQDDQGLIYFTTNQGIWRFDGTDVQAFNLPDADLPQGGILLCLFCYQHRIYFCYRNDIDLLYCFDKDNLKLYKYRITDFSRHAINPLTHEMILFSGRGDAFIIDKKNTLKSIFQLQRYKLWSNNTGPAEYLFDDKGKLYIFFRTNVAVVENNTLRFGKGDSVLVKGRYYNKPRYDTKTAYVARAFYTSKYLVAIYGDGFVIYNKNTLDKLYEYQNYNQGQDYFVHAFPVNDSIIVVCKSGMKGLPVRPSPGLFKMYTDIYPYSNLRRVWDTNVAGNYIASDNSQLYLLTHGPPLPADTVFRNSAMKFFNNKSIRGIYYNKGKLYVGTYPDLFIFSKQGKKRISGIAYAIQPYTGSHLMIGTEGGDGFETMNTQNYRIKKLPNPEHANLGITKLLRHNNGFIAAMRSSLYQVYQNAKGQWRHTPWVTDARIGIIKDIACIDKLWWVAGEGGLFRLEGNGFKKITIGGDANLPVYAILPLKDGILLATSGKGIIKIDGKGRKLLEIKFNNGLAGDFVYSLCKVDDLLFAGTNGGLSVFDMELNMQVLSNPDDGLFDGLYNQEFNHSAVFYDAEHRQVMMGGLQGLVFLDVDYYKLQRGSKTDQVILSYVKKGSNGIIAPKVNLFAANKDGFVVMPNENPIVLKFAGSFKQKDILFRIREISDEWRKNKLSDEVSLYSLPPGNYTLQTRFPSNTDPKYWLTKTIIVVPNFYQTWIFKGMIILIIMLIIYQIWLSRIKKLKNEMQLRTNIASDLHDEIGSTLTRISLSSELMYVTQRADEGIIQHISNDSKNAIASISDIIWSVDARNDNKEDLILRMQEHMHNMLAEVADLHVELTGLEKTGTLPQLIRQNIYLIFKEAINNIVRHNYKPSVSVTLNNQLSGMTISIKNTIDPRPKSEYAGQGLKNMQMRANRIKAKLTISSTEDYFLVTIKTRRW